MTIPSSLSLPELPEGWMAQMSPNPESMPEELFFTEDMQDYGKQCARAALEAAINTVEDFDTCDPKYITEKLRALLDQLK